MNTVFFLLIGYMVGLKLSDYLSKAIVYFQNRSILKAITPTTIVQERLCKAPHSWMNVKSLNKKGQTIETKVCRVCGLIEGTNRMATEAGIDKIEENMKIMEVEDKVYQDFIEKENNSIRKLFDEELKQGLNFDKLAVTHNAGITFGARFNKYKVERLPEMLKELLKSDA